MLKFKILPLKLLFLKTEKGWTVQSVLVIKKKIQYLFQVILYFCLIKTLKRLFIKIFCLDKNEPLLLKVLCMQYLMYPKDILNVWIRKTDFWVKKTYQYTDIFYQISIEKNE